MHARSKALAAIIAAATVYAQNSFEIVGDALVSSQQLFLVGTNTLYSVDKTEANPTQINGHSAWASRYDLTTNQAEALELKTNSFCAGGIVLGDGRWINAVCPKKLYKKIAEDTQGGNLAVASGGVHTSSDTGNPYEDTDGGNALRVLDCSFGNDNCVWIDSAKNGMVERRWYPTLETLPDGSAIILGGDMYGGFINQDSQAQNSWELWPNNGQGSTPMQFLNDTMPTNLYPLTWLLPSGKLFMQAGWMAQLFDWKTNEATPLPNITGAQRCYPASAASASLPQTPANNWTLTALLCGGGDYQDSDWAKHATNNQYFRQHPNSDHCTTMSPDVSQEWVDVDPMPEARSMGNFIALPDGRMFLLNGVSNGTAGYDEAGIPYGTNPIYAPAYFDPSALAGSQWSREGVQNANLPRLYHSTATLLPDGSVAVAGSNPYTDFQTNGSTINIGANSNPNTYAEWWSETRIEIFKPSYFSMPRPAPTNLPTSISYGGNIQQVSLSANDIANVTNADQVKAVLIRTGFSTHGINFGMRMLQLETSLVQSSTGGATLNIAPLPANPAVLAPGPCLLFIVVNGVPSIATEVMVGSGSIGTQYTSAYPVLPSSSTFGGSNTSTITGNSTMQAGLLRSTNKNSAGQKNGLAYAFALGIAAICLAAI